MDSLLQLVIILVLCTLHTTASPDSIVQTCCRLGQQWQPQSRVCKPYPGPIRGIEPDDQKSCLAVIELCCLYEKEKKQCERGKQIAKVRQSCTGLHSQLGNENMRECCNCCHLGVIAKKSRLDCNAFDNQFSPQCNSVILECCTAARPPPPVSAATPAPPSFPGDIDECAQFPGQLCAHNCINTISSYKCTCRAGFTLQADGRTCSQDEARDLCGRNNPCQHLCTENDGSIECKCFDGYSLQSNGRSCHDIDECVTGQHTCNEHQTCVNSEGTFTCEGPSGPPRINQCDAGYAFNKLTSSCEDIDECVINIRPCRHNQECYNTIGSFLCRDTYDGRTQRRDCPPGFVFKAETFTCEDLNECSLGRHNCGESEQCINTGGSFYCRPSERDSGREHDYHPRRRTDDCEPGFAYNRILSRCEDINECLAESHTCTSPEQQCYNTQGSFTCRCADGYKMSRFDRSCEDINECLMRPDACMAGQTCENTVGSYTCRRMNSCGTGYTLDSVSQQCIDDDECSLGTDNCGVSRECHNTPGSFRCISKQCPPGYRLDYATGECQSIDCSRGMKPDESGRCVDMNECIERPEVCRPNEECQNTVGSYICKSLVNCGPGFRLNNAGTRCEDINECQENTHDCRGARMQCINRAGSFTCKCPAGFQLNSADGSCDDINECEIEGGQVCSVEAVCENTPGSYRCNCKEGFRPAEEGNFCKDIDECQRLGMCQHECRNTWGSFKCICRTGYEIAEDGRTCQDIDECAVWEERGGRLCVGVCENTLGSYICTCPNGYQMLADGKTCQDIDECATRTADCFGEDMACINTRGSYKCESVKCPNGFVKARSLGGNRNSGLPIDADHYDHRDPDTGVRSLLGQPPPFDTDDKKSLICQRLRCVHNDIACLMNRTKSIQWKHVSLPVIYTVDQPIVIMNVQTVGYSIYPKVRFMIVEGNEEGLFEVVNHSRSTESGSLMLVKPAGRQATYHLKLQMDNLNSFDYIISTHIAFITVDVQPF